MLRHPSQDFAEHVVPASRALRFTEALKWRSKAGLYNTRPSRSSTKHASLAERSEPQKACFGFYSRAETSLEF
jgi:hypothetical protein